MANFSDVYLFPGLPIDTCVEDTLADEDFLRFLQDADLTGPLPAISDDCQPAAAAWDEHLVGIDTAPAVTPVAHMVPSPTGQPLATGPVSLAFCSTAQPCVQVQQPQAMRALSVSSSDASAAAAGLVTISVPGSPVSSIPTCSSDTSGHPPLARHHSSSGTSRQQRQSSTDTASISRQLEQSQPQKPLTKQQIAANKRRAPEVDWRSIDDPAERRKQRRLAKNRITAARSRERKKEQIVTMEDRMSAMEQENSQMRVLLASLTQENTILKEQLASLSRGASPANNIRSSPEPAVLKCLAIMHLVCCLLVVRASLVVVGSLVSAVAQQSAFGMLLIAKQNSQSVLAASCDVRDLQSCGSSFVGEGCRWHGSRPRLKHINCAA